MERIGLLHPGAMGAAIGRQLVTAGHEVLWTSSGRSAASASRAAEAGLTDVVDLAELMRRSTSIISICPPDAAQGVAESIRGFDGAFLDANAVSPATAATIQQAASAARAADGGIIGPPPIADGTTRLYLSGSAAEHFGQLFAGSGVDARVLPSDGGPFAASALKIAFAAWSKGSAALLVATAEAASRLGVGQALADEWAVSRPGLERRLESARQDAAEKGWRWAGEMEEIAAAFEAVNLPTGFHRAAAELYRDPPAG